MPEHAAQPLVIRLFGPFEVRRSGAPLPRLRSTKGQWLLSLLVLRAGQSVSRAWLAALLWPDCSPSRALANLRTSLNDLRRALAIEACRLRSPTSRTLCLDLGDAETDLLTFDHCITRGDALSLAQAVALYRGPLLEGCQEEWVVEERRAREEAYLDALETLAAGARSAGDLGTAEQYLRAALATDPFREGIRRSLMQVLTDKGNYAAALLTYRDLRLLLHRELTAEPDPATQRLFHQIRAEARECARDRAEGRIVGSSRHPSPSESSRGTAPQPARPLRFGLRTASRAPAPTAATRQRPGIPRPPAYSSEKSFPNLPIPLTRFLGRDQEIAEICDLLERHRVVTLMGAGGCGKSRLALELARARIDDFADGVGLVEFAALSNPALVPQAVAAALTIRGESDRPLEETLVRTLRDRRLLLVLDNCEHLLTACAALVESLLRASADLRILSTSRQRLGIPGEQLFRVPSLSLPDPSSQLLLERLRESEAIQLFVDRACLVQPTFTLTEVNAPAVVRVCRQLDGIPLAIELAAARVQALSVEKIAERLQDRFQLLVGGSRTALPRHQTLRALIDWSYDRLSEPERALLRRLSVFAGGWSVEAAEAVCGEEDQPTTNDERPTNQVPLDVGRSSCRYADPGVVRRYEVLVLLAGLVDQSLVVYEEDRGEARYRLLETIRQYGCDRLLEAGEAAGVRERHREYFLQLAEQAEPELWGPNQSAWLDRLEREQDNLRAALEWSTTDPSGAEPGLRLVGALRWFWSVRECWQEGRQWVAALLNRDDAQKRTIARVKALLTAQELAYNQSRNSTALAQESLTLARELNYIPGIAWSLHTLAHHAWAVTDPEATARCEEVLALFQDLGDKAGVLSTLQLLGWIAMDGQEYAHMATLCEQGLALARQWGDRRSIAWSLLGLGVAALGQREIERARTLMEESVALFRELGHRRGIDQALLGLGRVLERQGAYQEAETLAEERLALCRQMGDEAGVTDALQDLGYVALRLGDPARAAALVRESLTLWPGPLRTLRLAWALEVLAAVAVAEGRVERAVRLFGAAEPVHEEFKTPVWRRYRDEYEATVEAARTRLGEEAFAASWAAGRGMTREEAVAFALESAGASPRETE